MLDNKRLVPICIIIILSQSCTAENIDPEKIIGKTTNNVIYGDDGIHDGLYDNNSNRFTILGVKYKKRCLVYKLDNEGIIFDYYFSDFVNFGKIQKLETGTHYDIVVKMAGKPFTEYFLSDRYDAWEHSKGRIEKRSTEDMYICHYLQLYEDNTVSNYIVVIKFDINKNLVSTTESRVTQ